MTYEEKQLLLRDLSARLSYGVMFQYQTGSYSSTGTSGYFPMVGIVQNAVVLDIKNRGLFNLSLEDSQCKPYLRPMSSMTDYEKEAYRSLQNKIVVQCDNFGKPIDYVYVQNVTSIDWLLSHHFDFRELIEKGLALEALEEMYNIK